jgi:hypothetical protein
MGEVKAFPLGVYFGERNDTAITFIYALSSNKIVHTEGLPESWLHVDADIAKARLVSAGWIIEGGEVKE